MMEKYHRRPCSTACLVILLMLLLGSREAIGSSSDSVVSEGKGRTCESQSHGFKGRCVSDHNCGLVCRNEGFGGGKCRGFRGRCFCTKPCT